MQPNPAKKNLYSISKTGHPEENPAQPELNIQTVRTPLRSAKVIFAELLEVNRMKEVLLDTIAEDRNSGPAFFPLPEPPARRPIALTREESEAIQRCVPPTRPVSHSPPTLAPISAPVIAPTVSVSPPQLSAGRNRAAIIVRVTHHRIDRHRNRMKSVACNPPHKLHHSP